MTKTAFEGVNLVAQNGEVLPDSIVLVNGKYIEKVGHTSQIQFQPGEHHVINGRGQWLIPGLINCHDHLLNKGLRKISGGSTDATSVKAWRMELFQSSPSYQGFECAKNAMWELGQGVTTIRELGGPSVRDQINPAFTNVDLRDAIEGGFPGPRILACRLAIAMTGGHGHPWYGIREADGTDEVRKAVREQLKGGADVIKIMSSAGTANYPHESPDMTEFTVAELSIAVEEAHRRNVPVTTHAMGDEAVKNALEAGIDTIEHGFLVSLDTIERMADARATFVPTATVCKRIVTSGSGALAERMKAVLPNYQEAVMKAKEMGIIIGIGTDSRHTMVEEMETLMEFGMSTMDVLAAATNSAAQICGLSKLGAIKEGYIADLILIGGNPLENIRAAFEDIRMVMKEGQVMIPAAPITLE